MNSKVIKNAVIIPEDLYVERNADKQLEEVIIGMGKPAYISVPRQMGKTNLLMHTKRKLENANNRFIFIDITNNFENAQACFRYIVNQIIYSNINIPEFKRAESIIKNNRLSFGTTNVDEYHDEIEQILNIFDGNIVVFLDEIDALRKHDFSDVIFSQIRKTYALRFEHPCFNRFSYVLCGVIEPDKLIRNTDNSPFNIATRIYLNDFTEVEFNDLVKKSKLPLNFELTTYVYNWLRGNPRMSYDVLSRIEDESFKGQEINTELIDYTINDIYLNHYNHPPIDHIRELVRQHKDVRRYIVSIKKGENIVIPDEILNKLYLFGIINSRNHQHTTIKNTVIDRCLSFEWLDQLDINKKDLSTDGFESQLIIIEDDADLAQNYMRHLDLNDLISQVAYISDFNALSNFISTDNLNRIFWIDINLGFGRELDGLTMIRIIRERIPDALIIVHSAYGDLKEKCFYDGANYFFLKQNYVETIKKIRTIITDYLYKNGGGRVMEIYAEVASIDTRNNSAMLECNVGNLIVKKRFPLNLISKSLKEKVILDMRFKIRIVEKQNNIRISLQQIYGWPDEINDISNFGDDFLDSKVWTNSLE